jgi:UDP-N-acetylmuramate--alanine ligase
MNTSLPFPYASIHFAGIFGSGMSAIAQYLASANIKVSGSDRLIDSPDSANVKRHLVSFGCAIFPQDGSGVTHETGAVCVSTAIEGSNPDIAAARGLDIPILHRSDVLAALVKNSKSVAVAGTSGKSTVTAMIFELLTACGKSPSLISGAGLRSLEEKGTLGNSFRGESDLLVIEADESDGTLVKYEPYAGVILNISKDHKPEAEVLEMFERLVKQSRWSAVNADDPKLGGLGASMTFGFGDNARFRGVKTRTERLSSTITVDEKDYTLPVPGDHNASNLLAALCVCKHLGCDGEDLARAIRDYKGVDRRFSIYNAPAGITVIDDFAHNPEKIRAAAGAAKNLCDKLIAAYQPHGFGPTRFLKNEYAATFKDIFRPSDTLILLPIYYAGGTAVKDISSQDIIDLMGDVPFKAIAADGRDEAVDIIKKSVQQGSCVLLMGARDPSLPSFARRIVDCVGEIC